VIVGSVALAGVVLVGCGKQAESGQVLQTGSVDAAYLSQAARSTKDAQTGSFAGNEEINATGLFYGSDDDLHYKGDISGAYDSGAHLEHDVFTVTQASSSGGSFMDPTAAGDTDETVVTPGGTYVRRTLGGKPDAEDGKPWHRFDTDKDAGSGGSFLSMGSRSSSGAGTPNGLLDALESVSTSVTDLGTEDVRGVPTRHLQVGVSEQKLDASSAGSTTVPTSSPVDQCRADTTIPFDVFVDAAGLVRRVSISADLSASMAAETTCLAKTYPGGTTPPPTTKPLVYTIAMSVDFFDFGQPVTITIPDPSQVSDGSSVTTHFSTVGSAIPADPGSPDGGSATNATGVPAPTTRR
jgi:hypothetical protein